MNFKDKVVYQVYPKSFQDSNGDGWGDIKGIISRLDYLKDLGIDVIWFNPMCISPQKDNGYDVADYRTIDARYGTNEDFLALSKACKERNILIMFDMVFNHTSTEHEWFKKALAGDQKYKDYYIWRKGKNGTYPTNWQSKFGGPAWEYVPELDEYYLHLFDKTQADLNWENPDVRKECADIVNYWISKGVYCFRFDVVNLISKSTVDEDDPNNFDGRQFYTDGPRVHEYLRELNESSFGKVESITVGEMSSTTLGNCAKYANEDGKELSMVFTFHHLKVDYRNMKKWELQPVDFMQFKKLMNTWQSGMEEKGAWPSLFLNNHDQPRALSRFGDDKNYPKESGKMLATFTHLMRGTPYIYQGEEIGMTNAYFTDISQYKDVESTNIFELLKQEGKSEAEIYHILQERSRDNSRTPMQWDASLNAGFCKAKPWLQVQDNYRSVNVENALKDEESIYYWYKKLIQLRKGYKVVQEGSYTPLFEEDDQILAFERKLKDESLIVICNFYGKEKKIVFNTNGYEILLSNYKDSSIVDLRPYETVVLYKKA